MKIDWNRYRIKCTEACGPPAARFLKTLEEGTAVATAQTVPVYAGEMMAALVTIRNSMVRTFFQMMDEAAEERRDIRKSELSEKSASGGKLTPAGMSSEERNLLTKLMQERFFRYLAQVRDLEIAAEYVRTRMEHRSPDPKRIADWFQEIAVHPTRIRTIGTDLRKTISVFAGEEVPRLVSMVIRD